MYQRLGSRAGWALLTTVVILAVAVTVLTAALALVWPGLAGPRTGRRLLRPQWAAQSAIAFAVWSLEQDPTARVLNTSYPAAAWPVPGPVNSPYATVQAYLDDPAAGVTIQGPSSLTVQTGVPWALAPLVTDAAGRTVSGNDLTLDWTASGSGAVQWVAPGTFSGTSAGTVTITVPQATTATGSVLPLTSTSVTVDLVSSDTSRTTALLVSPASATLTLGATVPLTAVEISRAGETAVTSACTWSTSNASAVTLNAGGGTGETATAVAPGSATITCTDGSLSASTTLTAVAPTRIVTVVPVGTPRGAGAVVQITGASHTNLGWYVPLRP